MGCNCNKSKVQFKVKLPGGLTVTKRTLEAATQYAARHPGSTVIKPAQAA